MIRSIRHKALAAYWTKGRTKGLNAQWISRISRILRALDVAREPRDMDLPGYYFHGLTGRDDGRYSVRVTANFRITFAFEGEDAIEIDLEDYH
ncbi:type II toxin-antitoxin system RelE/ParE family toxin [Amorphus sp. 3PC139-8]|uniref:type II toxin-antitoxin system RelE/ParE family toxin n=1 Tax=Amorphus sp. 3PC139-8 TaxID=2735676 RepID=UPI00345DF685